MITAVLCGFLSFLCLISLYIYGLYNKKWRILNMPYITHVSFASLQVICFLLDYIDHNNTYYRRRSIICLISLLANLCLTFSYFLFYLLTVLPNVRVSDLKQSRIFTFLELTGLLLFWICNVNTKIFRLTRREITYLLWQMSCLIMSISFFMFHKILKRTNLSKSNSFLMHSILISDSIMFFYVLIKSLGIYVSWINDTLYILLNFRVPIFTIFIFVNKVRRLCTAQDLEVTHL